MFGIFSAIWNLINTWCFTIQFFECDILPKINLFRKVSQIQCSALVWISSCFAVSCHTSSSWISGIAAFCVQFSWGIIKGMLKIQCKLLISILARHFIFLVLCRQSLLHFDSCLRYYRCSYWHCMLLKVICFAPSVFFRNSFEICAVLQMGKVKLIVSSCFINCLWLIHVLWFILSTTLVFYSFMSVHWSISPVSST